jgi:hypothetical protein
MSRSEPVPSLESGNPYTIEWARFETGERLPLLVRRPRVVP